MVDGASNRIKVSLRVKIAGMLLVVFAIFTVAYNLYTTNAMKEYAESEMLEESRMLVAEMNAIWDFISINQNTINYDSNGYYDYKGLHCAIAGKSVAALFSQHTDYELSFTNLNPRNIANRPDEYEAQVLEMFLSDQTLQEYYGIEGSGDEQYFRYMTVMPVTEYCVDCHGGPAGEIDLTGYAKEGWDIGDIAGAISLKMPVTVFYGNATAAVNSNMVFFGLIAIAAIILIFLAFSGLIAKPITKLTEVMRNMELAPNQDHVSPELPPAYLTSKEMEELYRQFDALSASLSDLYGSLESQVDERTLQLSEANAELEKQRLAVERANQELSRENQYKSDFLAIVSHELRTPLTSILAFADLLAERIDPENSDAAQQLAEIQKNGATLLEMVENILQTARIQAGGERLNPELVDMDDILGMVESANSSVALKKNVAFTVTTEPGVPLIMSDWEKVRRIVTNLVSNAIKFTPSGGSVDVQVSSDEERRVVRIAVADTGIGIPKDKHELVFNRFTQENMSTVRRYGGSGLGLFLVKELVGMLEGTVSLESEPGQGSVFTVELPYELSMGAQEGIQ